MRGEAAAQSRIVMHNFASDPDSDVQMSLKIDDIVLIQDRKTVGRIDGRADRWVYGRDLAAQKLGWFPLLYTASAPTQRR